MKTLDSITREELKTLLIYNPCTGNFWWRTAQRRGMLAGCRRGDGYNIIRANRVLYLASRLAWLYSYGEWPAEIDHIDRNPSNDSIWNLRDVSHRENMRNSRNYVDGMTKYRSSHYNASLKRYSTWYR